MLHFRLVEVGICGENGADRQNHCDGGERVEINAGDLRKSLGDEATLMPYDVPYRVPFRSENPFRTNNVGARQRPEGQRVPKCLRVSECQVLLKCLSPVRASANVSYRGQSECFRLSRCDLNPHSYVRVVDNIVVLIEDKREFFSGKIGSCSWQLDSTIENILDTLTRLADMLLIGSC